MNVLSKLGPFILAISWACSALAEGKLPVVASFSVLGDLVRVVGGERVDVQTLVGPDQDAHVFEPSPSDVKKVAQSRLLVSNGLGFDSWVDKLARSAAYQGTAVVASSGVLTKKSAEEKGHDDPHAWQDPTKVITYVRNISAALVKADPSGAAIYQRNASAYQAELVQLDSWAKVQFGLIPLAKRKIITSHDAFGYLGARYQVSFLAPQGVSTDSEASAKEVAMLIRQIKREKIKAVHVENMTNTRLLEQLSREAGVTAGATLYSDALSAQGGPADSYLKMMHYNITQLVQSMKLN